jgi:lysophospholipase L1-like esterase
VTAAAAAVTLSACGSGGAAPVAADPAAPSPAAPSPALVASDSPTPTEVPTTRSTPSATPTRAVVVEHSTPKPSPKPSPKPTYPPGGNIVAFGDSVPFGTHCTCTNFVDAYANLIGAHTHTKITVDNFSVSGSRSAGVVNLLGQSNVQAAVATAKTVLIMTGANDYNDAFDQAGLGAATSKVYPPVAADVQDNVTTAIGKIQSLNPKAHVVLLDYWASMEDGAVAKKDYDATAMAASIACTASTNRL